MTIALNLAGNNITADGFTGPVTGAITGTISTTSPVTIGAAGVYVGAGAPSLTAAQGSLYLNTTGSSTSTRAYINTTGSTTWTAITTAA